MTIKNKSRQFIQKAAKSIQPIMAEIQNMDRESLIQLLDECRNLSNTNCWWMEYRLAGLIGQEAHECLSFTTRKIDLEVTE